MYAGLIRRCPFILTPDYSRKSKEVGTVRLNLFILHMSIIF